MKVRIWEERFLRILAVEGRVLESVRLSCTPRPEVLQGDLEDSEREQLELLVGTGGRKRTRPSRQVHPAAECFVSPIDMRHALALRYQESGGGQSGIGAARGMRLQQGRDAESPCAKLMTALVNAAPRAARLR